jgi:hypothetical protein
VVGTAAVGDVVALVADAAVEGVGEEAAIAVVAGETTVH